MKKFVVCISDASSADRTTPVTVSDERGLGRIVQIAIDEFIAAGGEEIRFPLFIDIHPTEQFGGVRWCIPVAERK